MICISVPYGTVLKRKKEFEESYFDSETIVKFNGVCCVGC